jgi:hypothetical protein
MNSDEIIILLGAGASCDANIPVSSQMIKELEELIENPNENGWKEYKQLYYCMKSGVQYGFGITNKNEEINIESLVNTMDELIKSYEHPIFPFVGSWVPRLVELAGEGFIKIKKLKNLIIEQLKTWMKVNHDELCDYYYGIIKFQNEFQFPLNIFSLNYDDCLEKQCRKHNIECNRGFSNYIWEYKNFEKQNDIIDRINLYKLHGSIDWEINDNNVEEKDGVIEKPAIIFGTSYKLQYIDPFLYLLYEFRRQTLESSTKIINCIGYSFNDEHINGILGQALIKDNSKKLISVQPIYSGENDEDLDKREKERIMKKLNLENCDNILVVSKTAKNFMENIISKDYYEMYTDTDDIPF